MGTLCLVGCLILIVGSNTVFSALNVSLKSNGPAIRGSNVTFTAVVKYKGDSELKFIFKDNWSQREFCTVIVKASNTCNCTELYSREYRAGEYTVMVEVQKKWGIVWYTDGQAITTFNLTEKLNGNLILKQHNLERPNEYVAVNESVNHLIVLPDNEMEFLKENSSSIVVYWFVDCIPYGSTTGLNFSHTYTENLNSYSIDAVLIADNEPVTTTTMPPTTVTTTTQTTIVTTAKPNITTALPITTSTVALSNVTEILPKNITKNKHTIKKRNATINSGVSYKRCEPVKDLICNKSGIIVTDNCHSHGTYRQILKTKAPISNVNITGMDWLKHAELMDLHVKYSGTPPFYYCANYMTGQYNITGNETCSSTKMSTNSTVFPLVHYFLDGTKRKHTVVVIVENDVAKNVSRAIINTYQATVQAQLSVIVVPVVFCLIAVILIVFGVAYYQHRSRYTVEVADFDFGQQSHLDYKTFSERLRDSFRSAFNFREHEDTDPLVGNTRYNSMT